jgi:hypothetical protein
VNPNTLKKEALLIRVLNGETSNHVVRNNAAENGEPQPHNKSGILDAHDSAKIPILWRFQNNEKIC